MAWKGAGLGHMVNHQTMKSNPTRMIPTVSLEWLTPIRTQTNILAWVVTFLMIRYIKTEEKRMRHI